MGTASHYVIGDLIEVLETKDLEKTADKFKVFVKKYPDDSELSEINKTLKEAIKSNDKEALDGILKRLKELKRFRETESGGGTRLPFRDRRRSWKE